MITSKLHELYLKSNGVSTDTRKITKNSIFFSLKGKNFDGNEYALEALNNGAKYAVIDNKNLNNPNFIKVNNVLESLQKLSLFHRTKLINTIFIAITGSNGKTTTKELVHSVLSQKYKAKSTHGNLNNHIGVPLTLLNIKEDTDFAVVEMGANHIGEIKFLTNLIKPDLGYITNFGKAHLEGFGGFEGVIKGKSELYDWLLENKKPILINTNDKIQSDYINSKSITFGLNNNSKYIFKKDDSENFVLLNYNNIKIKSNLIGDYNLNNIGAAVSLGLHFKLDIKSIKKAIQNYTPNNNRSQLLNIKDKKIILDAYNANPTSMQLAIESFIKLSGKKILILGDMFELGLYTKEEHLKLIKQLEKINIKTYFVGKEFYKLKKQSNMFSFFKTKKDVTTKISKNRIREKNILIKGSRGMKMETILDYIK